MTALAALTARGAALPPATVEGRPRGNTASANQRGGPFPSGSGPPPLLSSSPLGAVPTQSGASPPKPRPISPAFRQRQAGFFRCGNLRSPISDDACTAAIPGRHPAPFPTHPNRHFLMPVPILSKTAAEPNPVIMRFCADSPHKSRLSLTPTASHLWVDGKTRSKSPSLIPLSKLHFLFGTGFRNLVPSSQPVFMRFWRTYPLFHPQRRLLREISILLICL